MSATRNEPKRMTIGQAAAQAGVRASTIRYYESVGVLPEPERQAGQRRYTVDVLRRLAIIDVAQRAGFTLEQIKELLDASGSGPAYESVRQLAQSKLPAVEALIERAEAVKRWLEVASSCECSTLDVCALFDDRALALPRRPTDTGPRELINVIAVPARAG
jgi:MerR family transcriptional regulator, redox-sensitive transcriptional activator SoxR